MPTGEMPAQVKSKWPTILAKLQLLIQDCGTPSLTNEPGWTLIEPGIIIVMTADNSQIRRTYAKRNEEVSEAASSSELALTAGFLPIATNVGLS